MNNKKTISNKLILGMIFPVFLAACNSSDDSSSEASATKATSAAKTAPALNLTVQSNYKPKVARYSYSNDNDAVLEEAIEKYKANLESYNTFSQAMQSFGDENDTSYPGYAALPAYDSTETYASSGTIVKYTDGTRHGVFSNKWWTQGELPSFESKSGPWGLISEVDASGDYLTLGETINGWKADIAYLGGDITEFEIGGTLYRFEAKYWTKDNQPVLTVSSGVPGVTLEDWKSPWKVVDQLDDNAIVRPNPDEVIKPPVCTSDCGDVELPGGNIVVPPMIPEPPTTVGPEVDVTPPPGLDLTEDGFPEGGYEFLRELKPKHWDWLFPMRSGKYVENGGTRNLPPFAKADGSTDTFSLKSFKEAVLEYNAWAKSKGYKEFLNEGTKSQQALEFVIFWAKSARETSGSWDNAPAPWIVNDAVAGTVWKGGLYWVEEVGYTTDENGMSTAINYVDAGSSYRPEPNRSYYGRGIIQLSWNYNYGAFSQWLYDNGMMKDVITSRDTLLKRPDYVATNGTLSILSGIWFWMTPQGAKPASQDVVLGDVTHVSGFSQDLGLPQRNDGGHIPTAKGETDDQAVMAYRIGTVINIVNGGLECNKAAAWHGGPMQRISYYNAFAKYFNNELNDVSITIVEDAVNVWSQKVSATSSDNLKMASCYAQKSYYGW